MKSCTDKILTSGNDFSSEFADPVLDKVKDQRMTCLAS